VVEAVEGKLEVGARLAPVRLPAADAEVHLDRGRRAILAAAEPAGLDLGIRPGGEDTGGRAVVGALDRDRHHVDVAVVGDPEPLERRDLERGVPRADQR